MKLIVAKYLFPKNLGKQCTNVNPNWRVVKMDPKELREISRSKLDQVLEALDAGQVEEAKELVKIMKDESKHCHDLMVDYVWILLTYIGRMFGEEEVEKALRFRHNVQNQVAERMIGMTPEDAIRFKAMINRGHHTKISINEEEDRFVLKFDPCNTGGRMLRLGLDKPPINLLRTKKAYPWTWSKENISYYCAHCAMLEIQSMEKGAPHPTFIYECPEDPNDPCIQYCYKKTDDVPERYFQRIGKKKPPSSKK